jgi:hypothetical protein
MKVITAKLKRKGNLFSTSKVIHLSLLVCRLTRKHLSFPLLSLSLFLETYIKLKQPEIWKISFVLENPKEKEHDDEIRNEWCKKAARLFYCSNKENPYQNYNSVIPLREWGERKATFNRKTIMLSVLFILSRAF